MRTYAGTIFSSRQYLRKATSIARQTKTRQLGSSPATSAAHYRQCGLLDGVIQREDARELTRSGGGNKESIRGTLTRPPDQLIR